MNFFLTLFLLILFLPSPAQNYSPMLEIGKTWNMVWSNDFGVNIPFNIEIGEKVDINDLTYFKVVSTRYDCEILLREDILEKKVYRLMDNQDILMFDFSLEEGDLVPDNFPISPFQSYPYIMGIGNGEFYNIPNLYYYDLPLYIGEYIESIGLYRNGILSCFDEGCQAFSIYEFEYLVGINEILSDEDFFKKNNINLFYNSKTKYLEIINSDEILHIEIFSILGNKLIDSDISGKLDLSRLNHGIFIYNLSKDNSIKSGKILVY